MPKNELLSLLFNYSLFCKERPLANHSGRSLQESDWTGRSVQKKTWAICLKKNKQIALSLFGSPKTIDSLKKNDERIPNPARLSVSISSSKIKLQLPRGV